MVKGREEYLISIHDILLNWCLNFIQKYGSAPKICKRCGRQFYNPIPMITNPKPLRSTEIISVEWCANCNRVGASACYRGDRSVYYNPALPFAGLSESTWRSTEDGQ
jgi:hypothetical protein